MIELQTKSGKTIGHISDSMSDEDYVVIDNKKVSLSKVYRDKKLRDALNDEIKNFVEPLAQET